MGRALVPGIAWALRDGRGAQAIDARLLPLIRGIAHTGTLVAAARSCNVPYRTAWGVLEDAGRALGTPLVTLARGRGASLTPLSRRWLDVDELARQALDASMFSVALRPGDTRVATAKAAPLLKVAASHDIALAQLKDRWRVGHGIALAFHGSAESLDAFHGGQAELAGFHVDSDASASDPLLARLDPSRDALLRFLTREQGLIVPRGNPKRVRTLADLASKRLAIVNRQPVSGTRLLFDRLLAREGVEPAALAGYSNEEFTHVAVAATIAAGRADAGFGIRAAAAQFGLAFLSLVTERYLFACRRRALDTAKVRAFRALLASDATRAVVVPLPGYALDGPGEVTAAPFAGATA